MARADRIKMELSNEDRKILRDVRDALLAANAPAGPQFTGRLVETDVNGFGGIVPQEALDLPSASKVNRPFSDAGDDAV